MRIGSATQSALSALQVETLRLQASAHNVANLQTDGYDPIQVEAQSQPGGGVTARVSTTDNPHPEITTDGETRLASNTDLGTEAVSQMQAANTYQANVKTLQAADEMTGTAIDLVA
jgi:flagellar basal body rod protein FlgG